MTTPRPRSREGLVWPTRIVAGLLTLALLGGCVATSATAPAPGSTGPLPTAAPSPVRPGPTPAGPVEEARVVRVVDGDTIVVDRGAPAGGERVRYIGIDTPESAIPDATPEPFGPDAAAANEALLRDGVVYLERDVSETDRFGRLLRYVWVRDETGAGWILVNLALIADGWATVTTFPPDVRHVDLFRAAQREAREAGLGVWGIPPSTE